MRLVVTCALAVVPAIATLPSLAAAEPQPAAISYVEAQTLPESFDEAEPPTTTASPAPPITHQLRFEIGVGGPGGLMGVRYSRVLSSSGTRIEPGVGLAYTGVIGSLVVTQPLFEHTSRKGAYETRTTFELYGGYSASHLADSTRHAWTGPEAFLPNGTYHWIDLGISVQGRLSHFVITAGCGVTKLVAGPAGIKSVDEDDTIWFLFPEGWIGRQRMAPALWSSLGYAF